MHAACVCRTQLQSNTFHPRSPLPSSPSTVLSRRAGLPRTAIPIAPLSPLLPQPSYARHHPRRAYAACLRIPCCRAGHPRLAPHPARTEPIHAAHFFFAIRAQEAASDLLSSVLPSAPVYCATNRETQPKCAACSHHHRLARCPIQLVQCSRSRTRCTSHFRRGSSISSHALPSHPASQTHTLCLAQSMSQPPVINEAQPQPRPHKPRAHGASTKAR